MKFLSNLEKRAVEELKLSPSEIEKSRKMNLWHKSEGFTDEEKKELVAGLVGNNENKRANAEAIVEEYDSIIKRERKNIESIPQSLHYIAQNQEKTEGRSSDELQ